MPKERGLRGAEARLPAASGTHRDDHQLGQRLRSFRIARNFSLKQLGESVGVSHQQVQKYESGRNGVSFLRLARFAKVLGVPVAAFLPEEPAGTEGAGVWPVSSPAPATCGAADTDDLPPDLVVRMALSRLAEALPRLPRNAMMETALELSLTLATAIGRLDGFARVNAGSPAVPEPAGHLLAPPSTGPGRAAELRPA